MTGPRRTSVSQVVRALYGGYDSGWLRDHRKVRPSSNQSWPQFFNVTQSRCRISNPGDLPRPCGAAALSRHPVFSTTSSSRTTSSRRGGVRAKVGAPPGTNLQGVLSTSSPPAWRTTSSRLVEAELRRGDSNPTACVWEAGGNRTAGGGGGLGGDPERRRRNGGWWSHAPRAHGAGRRWGTSGAGRPDGTASVAPYRRGWAAETASGSLFVASNEPRPKVALVGGGGGEASAWPWRRR